MAADKKIRLHRALSFPVILVALLGMFSSCVKDPEPDYSGLEPGDPLPMFEVTLNTGEVVSTASLQGKKTVIELFNTSCSDCRESLPVINELYELYHDDDDIMIFTIARDEKAPEIESFWQEYGLTLPYSPQNDRKVYELFASVGIPRIYIAGTDGIIRAAFGPENPPSLTTLTSIISNL